MLCNNKDIENLKEIIDVTKQCNSKIIWDTEEAVVVEITRGMFNASVKSKIRDSKIRMYPYMFVDCNKVYLEANMKVDD